MLNRIRDALRRRNRRPGVAGLDGHEADGGLSPLELAIGTEALAKYEHALSRLKPDEQEALIGRLEMGDTYQELADVLGKPSSEAARKAAQRALVHLVREMGPGASG